MVKLVSSISLMQAATAVLAATYQVTDTIVGHGFNSAFSYVVEPSRSHGRVNYVNATTAAAQNLTFASRDTFILRADHTTVLDPNGPGRNSVKLESNKFWSTAVFVFDIRHMPVGCGTWPDVFTWAGNSNTTGGQIDILEGINDQTPNLSTLHTSSGCTMPTTRAETGNATSFDCATSSGCGVSAVQTNTFGPPFNSNGGGWYAMERTNKAIKIWFWPRNAYNVPRDVLSGARTVTTDHWGTPLALFPGDSCNIDQYFAPQQIVINLTFCGDWAGQQALYSAAGCPSTCVDYVNNNPAAFTDTYFDFASIKVYTHSYDY